MRETKRVMADDGQSFAETTTGDAPSSIEVSLNAKGQAQFTVKLYFASPNALATNGSAALISAIREVKAALEFQRLPLAGVLESEARR